MMRRIGFRRLLPPVQLVLFGVLSFIAHGERQRQGPCTYYWSSFDSPVLAQEGDTVTFLPACRSPKAELIAGCLDMPAMFAGAALAFALRREGDLWASALSTPMVVLLWYWIGLWIDRRLGYVGPPRGRHFPQSAATMAFVSCVFLLVLSVITWLRVVLFQHHRVDRFLLSSAFLGWWVFLTAVTGLNSRRSRLTPPAEPQARLPDP